MNAKRKGWTDQEEAAFAQIMEAGGLERLPAIRLYRRLRCDLKRVLKYAQSRQDTVAAKNRGGKRLQGRFLRSESSQANAVRAGAMSA